MLLLYAKFNAEVYSFSLVSALGNSYKIFKRMAVEKSSQMQIRIKQNEGRTSSYFTVTLNRSYFVNKNSFYSDIEWRGNYWSI